MANPNFKSGTVWTGDNLHVMRGINSECVDLIYLDPPFNSNRMYKAPIGSIAAGAAFKDMWTLDDVDVYEHGELAERSPAAHDVIKAARTCHGKGMMSYLIFMAVRLIEMKRILKPSGSIWLHCDDAAGHYLKLLMDGIFGKDNYQNEITWERVKGAGKRGGNEPQNFGRSTDRLFFYTGTDPHTFNYKAVSKPYPNFKRRFNRVDEKGRYYRRSPFRPPGLGPAPNLCYEYKGVFPPHVSGWLMTKANLELLENSGNLEWENGKPYKKQRPGSGILPNNCWTDINIPGRKESTKYPTQKPLALLERIIKASSNEGDMVFDPFCGCATTLVSADRLNRQWAGADLSSLAIKLVNERIADERGLWGGAIALDTPPRRTDLGKLPNYRTNAHRLYGEQEGICVGCDTHFPFRIMEVDHKIPRAKGGTDHPDNLQLLCSHCNRSKGGKTMAEWRAYKDRA
ncbi:MAG: HNH endonuclease [Rhodobacteraceae bacterium]|nr:HNH endonuclease [Paracoccaceae bacterium]